MVSLTRSGSFMSSPRQQQYQRKTSVDSSTGITSGGGGVGVVSSGTATGVVVGCGNIGVGGGSDDSMHEKYFKSVENTPITRRRNTSSISSNQKHSSDSSPLSPVSPQNNVSSFFLVPFN